MLQTYIVRINLYASIQYTFIGSYYSIAFWNIATQLLSTNPWDVVEAIYLIGFALHRVNLVRSVL